MRRMLGIGLALVLGLAGCGGGGPTAEEQAATTAAIKDALDQIASGVGDQISEVSVQLRATDPIVTAIVITGENSKLARVDRDGLQTAPLGSQVGWLRPVADWQAVDYVGFAAGLKCEEPLKVSANASRTGDLMVAECAQTTLKAELDGVALPKLTDFAAEQTWASLLGEANALVDLTQVTEVALWGTGGLDGRPWFVIDGLVAGSAGFDCEMQWSRKPDPLGDTEHQVAAAGVAGCLGINAQAVTFDLSQVTPAEFAAAVSAASEQVGRKPGEVMSFKTKVVDGQLVLAASWGIGAAGEAKIVLREQAP